MRAFLFGTERIAATEKTSTPKKEKSNRRTFYQDKPPSYVVWPETEEKYCSLMRFGVPFVFVGKRFGGTISGCIIVNANLWDEHFWDKVLIEQEEGRALKTVETYNLYKTDEFREVDVLSIACYGVEKAGTVLDEAVEAELYEIKPAWQKYNKVGCESVQEVGIAVRMVMTRHCAFVANAAVVLGFLEWYLSHLDKPMDLVFVLQKPLCRPIINN